MRNIYFVRHAESDIKIHDDFFRPLTEKGMKDSQVVTKYLKDKNISHIFSSPYIRAVDTVKDLSDELNIDITHIDNFKERYMDVWIVDFDVFNKKQWSNFNYKLSDGECLNEVQLRNVAALMELSQLHPEANIVIGSHGTALSTIINHFNPNFGYEGFSKIKTLMPWIVKITFDKHIFIKMESINVLKNNEIITLS